MLLSIQYRKRNWFEKNFNFYDSILPEIFVAFENDEMIAVEKYGAVKGGALALWRILRCNPFSKGGYDPVP